jgi:phosphatidate cytidylyltransferase
MASSLTLRVVSSLVLAPPALAAAWLGSWEFALLASLAAILLAWEWTRLCLGRFGPGGYVLAAMGVLVAVLGQAQPVAALAVIVVAALLSTLVQSSPGRSIWWMALGAAYIGLPILSLIWLRGQGRETLLWLLVLVWATDIGAYASGITIGGPRLMPKISPKKTWAGLAGGVIAAAIVGWGVARLGLAGLSAGIVAAVSAVLAVVSQAGDLAESSIKRHFQVKDSSGLIPGHGGLFDRVDGLLAAAPATAALCLLLGGGLPAWR